MERAININPIVGVDISSMIIIITAVIVIHIHAPHSEYPSISVRYIHIPDLGDTTIIIVEYRNIFNLNYGTVIVILGIRTIIISRVEGDAVPATFYVIVYVKIELPIRVYRKRNAVLHKNKGVVVSISIAWCNLIFACTVGHNTGGAKNKGRK